MTTPNGADPRRVHLSVVDHASDRRMFLLASAAAAGAAACGPMMSGPLDTQESDAALEGGAMSGPEGGADTGSMMPGPDGGSMPGPEAGPDAPASCSPLPVTVGPVSMFAMNTWTAVMLSSGGSMVPFIVGRDAMGLYVYSATCTHNGCTVPPPMAGGTSVCPCHGSTYDANGVNLSGPARGPLGHVRAAVCSGMLSVDPSMSVPSTTRASV